jgi:hypothetical protein
VGPWMKFVTGGFAGPLCLVITIAGLILSVVVWRKKGARSGARGIAWSLLPLAAYLVHALGLVGRIVSAIVQFAVSFVFSPETYLGVILLAIMVVLFVVSGGLPLVRWRKRHSRAGRSRGKSGGDGQAATPVPSSSRQPAVPAGDDDLSDVRDILKRHGIS